MKMAVWSDVWNCLCISLCSGAAKNLRDPWFGEKSENFVDFGWLGERIQDRVLSICVNATADKASGTANFATAA
jgi:hypothetical protein